MAVASEGANAESLDQTEAIIRAGKHAWYDKPAGENWDQWQEIIAQAQAQDLLIQMGYMFRYHDGYCKIAEWVHSGFLGDVFAVRAHMSTFLGKAQKETVSVHQGGVFFDLSGHQLDQIVHLLGRPERVTPFLRDDMREVEGFTDNGVGIFEFERAIAIVDIAALEPRPNARRFEVYGTKGSAIMEPMEPAEKIRLCLDEARDGFEAGGAICRCGTAIAAGVVRFGIGGVFGGYSRYARAGPLIRTRVAGSGDCVEGSWASFRMRRNV